MAVEYLSHMTPNFDRKVGLCSPPGNITFAGAYYSASLYSGVAVLQYCVSTLVQTCFSNPRHSAVPLLQLSAQCHFYGPRSRGCAMC